MLAADNIRIELEDGTRQWTTIASVDSATQITVDTALTSAAASGATVYTYTTKMQRPLQILSARRENSTSQEVILNESTREDYFRLVNKGLQGEPTSYFYDPGTRDTSNLYLWTTSNSVKKTINITYRRAIQDFTTNTDNPDFPVEWYDAVIHNLAVRLAPAFRVSSNDNQDVRSMAAYLYRQVKYNNQERTPVSFVACEEDC